MSYREQPDAAISWIKSSTSQGYNPPMQYWLAASPWYGVILWIVLYTSDYYLTLYSSRGFREIGHFCFEGGFELTPQYRKDVDHLRPVSRLHLTLLVIYSLVILAVWWIIPSASIWNGPIPSIWECFCCWRPLSTSDTCGILR